MKEQLNPDFMNYRADSFYNSSTVLHNAQNYIKQGQSGWFAGDGPYSTYSEDLDEWITVTNNKNMSGEQEKVYYIGDIGLARTTLTQEQIDTIIQAANTVTE